MRPIHSNSRLTTCIYSQVVIFIVLTVSLSHQEPPVQPTQTQSQTNSDDSHHLHHHHLHEETPIRSRRDEDSAPQHDDLISELTDEQRKGIVEQVKANLLKVLGLKEPPSVKPQNKAFIPQAILEEYRKFRESVREIIPDDRDFYGKIDLDDSDKDHEDFWSSIYNKYGSYDIEIDMGPDDNVDGTSPTQRFHYKGDAKQISYLPSSGDPEDVPSRIAHHLPPITRSKQHQKQFVSVHLKFKLSQELIEKQPNDLKGAELYLSRERINDCEFDDSCSSKKLPFFHVDTSNRTNEEPTSKPTNEDMPERPPRYQRVYLLHITGYDKHNEPMTKIHDSQLIDTYRTEPLVFDMYRIVRQWLFNPNKNFGLIIRITNDDDAEFPHGDDDNTNLRKQRGLPEANSSVSNDENVSPKRKDRIIAEHVRLKRAFKQSSDSEQIWAKKQPYLMAYFGESSDATTRRHVKRDHSSASMTDMSSDTSPSTSTSSTYGQFENASPTNYYNPNNQDQVRSTTDESQYNENQTSLTKTDDNLYFGRSELQNSPSKFVSSSTTTTATITRNSATSEATIESAGTQKLTYHHNNQMSRRDSHRNLGSSNHRGTSSRHQHHSPVGSITSGSSGNSRRSKPKSMSRSNVEKCSRRTLEIRFPDVGWNSWIVAPLAYNANFCFGDCTYPIADIQNATNHAIIQSIFHSVGRVVPRSCCAPTKLARIAILYQIDGVVHMKHYDDMIVESCGCL